tara:strand:+ start:2739 stop:8381 length:5643 start_codon:yes stop_codon:yes gene_type:complete
MYRSRSSIFADITQYPYFDPTPENTEIGELEISQRSPLGIGWQLNYNMRVDLSIDGGVVIGTSAAPSPDPEPVILADNEPDIIMFYDGSGRWDQFDMYTTHDAVAGDPALYSNEKIPIQFQYSVYNAYITMFDENQVRYRFLPFYSGEDETLILPYAGRLHSITDTNGNEMTFSYETSNGVERLASMVDSLGHTINFFYHDDPGSSLGSAHPADHVAHLLWRVTDHAGRTVEYDYENISADYEARLISATLPSIENTSDFPLQYTSLGGAVDHARFPSGRKWQYNYAPTLPAGEWLRDGMISEIIDPNGVTIIQNEYDLDGHSERTFGRVIRQQYGDESYNYVFIDETNELDFPYTNKEYYVWVNDRRGAVIRYKYAKAAAPFLNYVPSEMQLLEKTEFLDFVDDPDLRVFAESDNGGLGAWKQISSTGVVSPLTGTIPSLANSVTTTFTPVGGWNTGSVTYPGDHSIELTYQNDDFLPPPGEYANPQLSRTVTSRTQRSADNSIVITENWLYDFGFGGGGCGCGSSDHYTAYKDGNGHVTRRVYDNAIESSTQRPNGNLLGVYRGLPSSFFSSTPFDPAVDASAATSVDEYTYNEWGQVETHTHPKKWILDDQGNEIEHWRVDKYEYYNNPSDEANYGRLHRMIIDFGGKNLTTEYEYDLVGNMIKEIDPGLDVTKYLYNQMSELVRVQQFDDANNLFAERMFFYDANGNMVVEEELNLDGDQAIDSSNKWFTTVHVYDKLDYRTETSREKNTVTGIFSDYDATTKQADSQALSSNYITQRWTYDENRNLIKFEDGEAVSGGQASNIVTHKYDARDLRIETVQGDGGSSPLKTEFIYNADGLLQSSTLDPNGVMQQTGYTFDGIYRVIEVSDPMGNEFLYAYDNNHNIVSVMACGPVGEDTVNGDTLYTLAKISRTYDALNRNDSQSYEIFNYDSMVAGGTGTCDQVPSSSTQQTMSIDFNSDSSIYKMISPAGSGLTNESVFYYDTASRLEFEIDGAGNITQSEYDADSNLTKLMQTDFSTESPPAFQLFEVDFQYDALDRQIMHTDGANNTSIYKYDSRSNKTEMTDARLNITEYLYDAIGRLVTTNSGMATAGGAAVTSESREYDDSSRLISETDSNGNTTEYGYDGLNRMTSVTMPDTTQVYSVQYNASGNPETYTDARGVIVTQTFDKNNRVTYRSVDDSSVSEGIPGATFEEFTYDGLGRLLTADNDFAMVVREYDSRSNVLSEMVNADAVSGFNATFNREVAYEFDIANNNTKITYPSQQREIYRTYDEINRLSGIFNTFNGTDYIDPITEFEYFGRRVGARIHGNGTRTDYSYNGVSDGSGGVNNALGDSGFGRLTQISTTVAGTSTILDQFEFTWDENQNRTSYDDTGSGMKNRRERTFGYDAINRLISTDVDFPDPNTDFTAPTNNGITAYVLDGVHNRTAVSGFEGAGAPIGTYSQNGVQADLNQYSLAPRDAGSEWAYFYDANGNLVERVQNSPVDYNGDYTVNGFDASAFNAAYNNGDPEADYNGDGQLNFFDVSAFLQDYQQDENTDLEHWHYSYDFRNQLVEVTSGFGTATPTGTINTYDALARRVLETSVGQTKQLVYGGVSHWEVLEQIDLSQSPESLLTTHVYAIGIDDEVSYRIEDVPGGEDFWTHRDDLNSLTSITDENGDVKERYEYGDFGEVSVFDASGSVLTSGTQFYAIHLYTGRVLIGGSGLYDLRFRILDPETGRFGQRDPKWHIDTLNLYQYSLSSPHSFTDPYGLSVVPSPPFFDPTDPRNFGRKPGQSLTPKKINWKTFLKNRAKGFGFTSVLAIGGCAAAILELDIACRVYFKYGSENWARCLCDQLSSPPWGAKVLCKWASKRLFDPIAAASEAAGCDILNGLSGGCR